MLDSESVLELRRPSVSDGSESPGGLPGLSRPSSAAKLETASLDACRVSSPHSTHASPPSELSNREPKMCAYALSDSPDKARTAKSQRTHSAGFSANEESSAASSIGRSMSDGELVSTETAEDETNGEKVKIDPAQMPGAPRRGVADVRSGPAASTLPGLLPARYGMSKMSTTACSLTPEEALKMLSECDRSAAPSAASDSRGAGHGDSNHAHTTGATQNRPKEVKRASHSVKGKFDDDLLNFLRSPTIQSLQVSRAYSVDDVTGLNPRVNRSRVGSIAASSSGVETLISDHEVPLNHSPHIPSQSQSSLLAADATSAAKRVKPFRHVIKQPDYASHFAEDHDVFTQLRKVFTDAKSPDSDFPSSSAERATGGSSDDLHAVSPLMEWFPEEPSPPITPSDPTACNDDNISLFKDCAGVTEYDEFSDPFFVTDIPDGRNDINNRIRLLRRVHESLYTTSEMASLGTIEKFMLELMQPDSDFGKLTAYGRLLAFINLSALRRYMSQLSALYRHPEMAVIRQVMRYNDEGAIKKVINISESVASGQMNDKAGLAAIAELMAHLDRSKFSGSDWDPSYGKAFNYSSNFTSGKGGSGTSSSSINMQTSRQLLAVLDDLSGLYLPGGEPHFPRYVCGGVDRRCVDVSDTLSIPFDKGDRRSLHVQFERLNRSYTGYWPGTTFIPQTITEGMRIQVLPTKQQAVMHWILGRVTSISSGVLMVAIDSTSAKEAGRGSSTDRMYMMRNFVPPNVPTSRLEKAQWRLLPREFDPERDIYVGSCLSVFDPILGGYTDRVIVNVLFGDSYERGIAPVKSPNDDTLFGKSTCPLQPSSQSNAAHAHSTAEGSAPATLTKQASSEISLAEEGATVVPEGAPVDGTVNPTTVQDDNTSRVNTASLPDDARENMLAKVHVDYASGTGEEHNRELNVGQRQNEDKIESSSATTSDATMNVSESTSSENTSKPEVCTAVTSASVGSNPTCHCNGHTLRVFEGRGATDPARRPKRVVLSSLYDRRDIVVGVEGLRAYKLNYDLQSHFDSQPDHAPTSTNAHAAGAPFGQFQHCVWVVPRTLPFSEVPHDVLSVGKTGSQWFFEPQRCLVMLPYSRSIDVLQEAPRVVSFLHPELNYMALCAGIWSVRGAGRTLGEVTHTQAESGNTTEAPTGRAEPISLTRSQKAATRELTVNDIVNEACSGVVRCHLSLVRRLFGCTTVISLWIALEGMDLDNVSKDNLTLSIIIPPKPTCSSCGGAVYARDDIMKILPENPPLLLTQLNSNNAASDVGAETTGATVASPDRATEETVKASGASMGEGSATSSAATNTNAASNKGSGTTTPNSLRSVEELPSVPATETQPGPTSGTPTRVAGRPVITGPAARPDAALNMREMPIFNDLETTEEVIRRFQSLASGRWRLTRECLASYTVDDDVLPAPVRNQQHAFTNPASRLYGGKSEFINKLALFLSSARRARETKIDNELYRGAYSAAREHFNPRSVESVLLRGWGAFILGQSANLAANKAQSAARGSATPGGPKNVNAARAAGAPGQHHPRMVPNMADPRVVAAMGKLDPMLLNAMPPADRADGGIPGASNAAQRRKPREEKRTRPPRGESPHEDAAPAPVSQDAADRNKKPRRTNKLSRMADNEYCEFTDKEIRYKLVSVVKWDEDLEPSALVSGAQ
ncbi:hypothetical protein, conserved [Babesia ovata]|uniref:Uncharacterized protein n=1 Tax=Babesia ovata TaxID=189622 RepID=A0A2H6K9B1_9APIC|nr:uncharacterized protein BOVATA_010870 [Babesia ovata]GBE59594.1 hypothetical protein, conserved [Babesia ovata]